MGLEQGPLSLVSTIEELLERKSSSFGLENLDYGHRGSVTLTTLHPSALTLLTSSIRSVGIVRSQTEATEFSFFYF
jgi:hypothetical protein